jgi:hypothetical protein
MSRKRKKIRKIIMMMTTATMTVAMATKMMEMIVA